MPLDSEAVVFKRYRQTVAAAALAVNGGRPAAAAAVTAPRPAGVASGRFPIAQNRFGRYAVPQALAQRLEARQVLRGGVPEGETLDFLRRSALSGDIVHAGASFGPFLPAISAALPRGCLLWAFEPNPNVFPAAEETAALNGLEGLELHDVGLGDADMLGYMPDGAGAKAEVLVSIVRLDSVVSPNRPVTAIHLGFSSGVAEALKGARRLIASRRPALVMEKPVPARWIAEHVCGGYEPAGVIGRNTVYRCP